MKGKLIQVLGAMTRENRTTKALVTWKCPHCHTENQQHIDFKPTTKVECEGCNKEVEL
jgi:ribosomal protein S27E